MAKYTDRGLICQEIIERASRTGEVLSDPKKSGKPRPWRKYKLQSIAISQAYHFFDELKKLSDRISHCGSFLVFKSCPKGHHKRLITASFCYSRLCVLCQWRKSLAMFHQVFTLVHKHKEKYKSDVPLLLTLTVPNVNQEELPYMLDLMQHAFKKMMKRRGILRSIRSWFRSLEITYNEERDDYHPHFHVLLMVPENYFDKRYNLFIHRDEWLAMWQEATGIREITQVDVRRVKKRRKGDSIEIASAEVSKYATKPSSYVKETPEGDYKASKGVVKDLHGALKGRRLVGFGGLFVKIRREMKMEDIETADLVKITDEEQGCSCPVCQSTLVQEMFKWHAGLRNYVG